MLPCFQRGVFSLLIFTQGTASPFSRQGGCRIRPCDLFSVLNWICFSVLFSFRSRNFGNCIHFSPFFCLHDTLESLPYKENCHVPFIIDICSWSLFQYHWPTCWDRDFWPIWFWEISVFLIGKWGTKKFTTCDFHGNSFTRQNWHVNLFNLSPPVKLWALLGTESLLITIVYLVPRIAGRVNRYLVNIAGRFTVEWGWESHILGSELLLHHLQAVCFDLQ